MTSLHGFRVSMTTMGTDTPGPRALCGGYRYRDIPGWRPGDVRFDDDRARTPGPKPGFSATCEAKAERFAQFCDLRAEDVSVAEAGRRAGIARRTARNYEQERLTAGPCMTPRQITAALHAEIAAKSPEHAALVAVFEQIPRPGPWSHKPMDISVMHAARDYEAALKTGAAP